MLDKKQYWTNAKPRFCARGPGKAVGVVLLFIFFIKLMLSPYGISVGSYYFYSALDTVLYA